MSGILEMLAGQIGGDQIASLSRQLGVPEDATQKAIATALPALIGGLASNASTPQGAQALASALDRDHDGSLLDQLGGIGGLVGMLGGSGGQSGGGLGGLLGGLLGGGRKAAPAPAARATNGAGILGHIFGGKQASVEKSISQGSGLDMATVAKLLPMLAPLVMGALGKTKKAANLDAGALAGMLGEERTRIQTQEPALGGLMGMLDSDGDGDIKDDLGKLASGMLGQFLKR